MMNTIYLRRRSKVVLPTGTGTTPITHLATVQKNLEALGFLLEEEITNRLKSFSPTEVDAFYQRLVKDLRVLVGAHREFKPFYPNFPTQVMELSEAELYFNAIEHYWTGERPQTAEAERPVLDETPTYRIIRAGSHEDFQALFTSLAKSKSPYSVQDKEDVAWFVTQYRDGIRRLLPEQIPCKENLATLGAAFIRHLPEAKAILDPHIRTATDVLRLAVALSDGDVSLKEAVKFGKFRRRDRSMLLSWVERATNRTEDMLRWKPRWIRLGERLHPGEYAKQFPQTAAAFDILRNNRPVSTFNSRIEAGLAAKDTATILDLLDTRPGELARRLDHLVRISPEPDAVVQRFAGCASAVSTPVLLQVMTHFQNRDSKPDLRVFFPKGAVAKLFATITALPKLPAGMATRLAEVCELALLDRFAKLPPLGACYVDPRLKNFLVPFSQRSAAKSLRTLVRGSRLPLPECRILRFFVWWKNGKSRVDIDLSAAMYDTNYGHIDTLAYYNLKSYGGHHSGDITDAPKGAAEFIDIDVNQLVEKGVRYVVMCLNSYTNQPYCDLPECFAGWMARSEPASGEVFEPKTVIDKVDVASDTRCCLPAIFDLTNREVLWADIALEAWPRFANNVHNNLGGVSMMLWAMTTLRKTTLLTLFNLHVRARGQLVPDIATAQTVFAVDQGLTPFDLERITADFL
jgi:hypothetical protein